jgi:hypothetical protein
LEQAREAARLGQTFSLNGAADAHTAIEARATAGQTLPSTRVAAGG